MSAEIEQIIAPSDLRVPAKCKYFGKCGGCQWQHLAYDCQLEWKQKIIQETWERIAKKDVDVLDVIPSPKQWNYRNRIQLHVDSWGKVGFKRTKSHEVVDIEKCLIADDKLNQEFAEKKDQMKYWQKGLGLKLDEEREGAGSFAQVNTSQNVNLKKVVSDLVKSLNVKNVVELYAGSGNLTYAYAESVDLVIANDIDKKAVKGGNEQAKKLGFDNIKFEWGSAEKTLENTKEKVDLVLLDPPRTGAKETMDFVAKSKPEFVLYVSCDPPTLARDSIKLFDEGYEVMKCQPLDMFPQTFHVETIALFGR